MVGDALVDPASVKLWREEGGGIALQMNDGDIHRDIRVRRAAPLSDPEHYLVFLDNNGRELAMVCDPRSLRPECQEIVASALEHHYLTSQIVKILSIRIEAEVCYFAVETSRGPREFVIPNLQDGLRLVNERKLLFVDVDGNRFEIDDMERLDRRSVALLRNML
jgi:uncharacterized protein DUF1854